MNVYMDTSANIIKVIAIIEMKIFISNIFAEFNWNLIPVSQFAQKAFQFNIKH